ncbi:MULTISPECIES: tetratricopeptide repeat protein [Falsihalocynthiibacter]|uniref:tetratricopeptide repeat protein n=1 Tax=Falsihalocynthiibacter TaxID=2854182 RepID=UPI00300113B2
MYDWIKISVLAAALTLSQPVFAQDCPASENRDIEKNTLHAELLAAPKEMLARPISDQLWMIWNTAPDARSQQLLDLGREQIRYSDYDQAVENLTDLVEYCPDYAEGWNQRAFAHFLRHDYDAALDDISVVLELEPRHFGALAGRASVLISTGRTDVGFRSLRDAMRINPWISERHMLPPGEDI